MTVVIAVKVYDGIVLAADSATALPLFDQSTTPPTFTGYQVWNNGDKVFHLHRDLPIGMATWGSGQIDSASIATLAKDLRRRLMGKDTAFTSWELDGGSYTMQEVANRVIELMHGELYSRIPAADAQFIGFVVAGYSAKATHPELWEIHLEDVTKTPIATKEWGPSDSGWRVMAQPDAVARLFNGHSPSLLPSVLGIVDQSEHVAVQALFDGEGRAAVWAAMPFADAVAFAKFCVETTEGYVRFSPGADLVGGPVDVAAISKHEGFKWVQRKHYYPSELNPRRPHEHDQ